MTPEHPFYLAENTDNSNRPKPIGHEELSNKWVGAGHLKAGDRLKKADGTFGTVVYVNTLAETRKMYNLEVQSAHTFFVGQNGWLTHNSCDKILSNSVVGILEKPQGITDKKLQNIIDDLFRSNGKIPGGTAGAVRREQAKGVPVGGKFHDTKAKEYSAGLYTLIQKGNLSGRDLDIANAVYKDLQNALRGK
ncbi:MAG: Hint domain-containing protein [Deinococcaceae bacterium]